MDIFTAIGKLFNVVLDAARAPQEQHEEIVREGLARETEAVQVVRDYYARTRDALDESEARLAAAERRAEEAKREAEEEKQRHAALRAAVAAVKSEDGHGV